MKSLLLILLPFGVIAVLLLLWFGPKYQARTVPQRARPALENEFRRTLAQIVGGVAVLLGLYGTWQQLQYTSKSVAIAAEGQVSERYAKALEQLGNDQITFRLGAVYSLAEIARRKDDHLWSVIQVLTAFIRDKSPYDKKRAALKQPPDDIQAALWAISNQNLGDEKEAPSRLHVMDLSSTDLRSSNVPGAWLTGADFTGAHLEHSELSGAHLEKAILVDTHLEEVSFSKAHLEGANLIGAYINGAVLSGAFLSKATLVGANLSEADLRRADLKDAH
jgi:hypothetical protein